MPNVHGKKFPYTPSGKAAAKRALKKLVRKDGRGGPGDYTIGGLKPLDKSFGKIKPPGMSIPDNYSDNTAARSAIGLKTSQVMRPGPRPVSRKDEWMKQNGPGIAGGSKQPTPPTLQIGGSPNPVAPVAPKPIAPIQPIQPKPIRQPYDITALPNYNPALPFSGLTPEQQTAFANSSSNYQRGFPEKPTNPKLPMPRVPLQPKIDYGNAPQGTQPPIQPLPSGAIGWFWYNGQWNPNYQRYSATTNSRLMGKLIQNRLK